jgi:hypothetical protein
MKTKSSFRFAGRRSTSATRTAAKAQREARLSFNSATGQQFRKVLLCRIGLCKRRPTQARRCARFVCAVTPGRRWLDELSSGAVTDAHQLVRRERCTVRQANLTLSLAFQRLNSSSQRSKGAFRASSILSACVLGEIKSRGFESGAATSQNPLSLQPCFLIGGHRSRLGGPLIVRRESPLVRDPTTP